MEVAEGIEKTSARTTNKQRTSCHHCGEQCPDQEIVLADKYFCCTGCKTVYEILSANDLCRYYELDQQAGISLRGKRKEEYAYLDDPEIKSRIIDYTDGKLTKVSFFLPQIHCASCLWLLENLYRLCSGVQHSKVNFLKKEVYISFLEAETTLRTVVETLAGVGYAPVINLQKLEEEEKPVIDRKFYYKLGVAGFAFGNIMLLSFPEYLGLDKEADFFFFQLFGYLNILLALPLVFFSAIDYLRSAVIGLKHRKLNIDVPISLGILTLFLRSVFEILTHSGAGYLDSLAGLIFFLLIGKWFQQRTYHTISFDRDYKSYFPIAARLKIGESTSSTPLDKLKAGDIILIKNQELIPADGIILSGNANIDYSFVSGESQPVNIPDGEKVFAGGRQVGEILEIQLQKKVSQSYLTQLWNDEAFNKDQETQASALANRVGKYFTYAILLIALATLAWWLPKDTGIAVNAFTAVLIIACPCAVALAIPFIFGNVLRILGKNGFYLKNTNIIEALANLHHFVFDKTGTLTMQSGNAVEFVGPVLSSKVQEQILAMTAQSTHPASQAIYHYIAEQLSDQTLQQTGIKNWQELPGKGISGQIGSDTIRIGSEKWVNDSGSKAGKGVYLEVNQQLLGHFIIHQRIRPGLKKALTYFQNKGKTYLLSGDNEREKPLFQPLFEQEGQLRFQQSPADKLNFIRQLQSEGSKVLMIGDGLNDAGALRQSDVGIVLTEDANNFTPASDAILEADRFAQLPRYLEFAQKSIQLVYGAYAFAFIYNVIGLSFAVRGALSPVVAAILMPLSSISIVLFGMLTSNWLAKRKQVNSTNHKKETLAPQATLDQSVGQPE